jgi:hypothetical protein
MCYKLVHLRGAGGMEGVEQRAYFADEERARAHVKSYVLSNLYEIFWYGCDIEARVKGRPFGVIRREDLVFDMLAGTVLRVDDAFEVCASTQAITFIDLVPAVRYLRPTGDGDESSEDLEEVVRNLLVNLSSLVSFDARHTAGASVLTGLKFAAFAEGPLPDKLEVRFAFPALPPRDPPAGPVKASEDWY